jgi:hypothetical protein
LPGEGTAGSDRATMDMSTTFSRSFIRWMIAAVSVSFWLGGCGGPARITDLREDAYRVVSFEVSADCETVYLRIVRRAQEQYRIITLATYQPTIAAKLAPDRQSATITLMNAGGVGLRYILTADLHAVEPTRTGVNLYCASRAAAQEAVLWQQWANTSLEGRSEPEKKESDRKDPNDLKADPPDRSSQATP